MISGEARVEGLSSPGSAQRTPSAERKLAIDGLRLQLDLRILPGAAGGDAAAAAVWRIESENVATLSLSGRAERRRAAVAAGAAIAALSLLAIALWFTRSAERPPEARRGTLATAPTVAATPPAKVEQGHGQPATPPASAAKRTGEAPPPAPEQPRVAPRIAVVPAEAEPRKTTARTASPRPIATPTPAPAPASAPTIPRGLPPGTPAGRDMLELFGDTK